MPDQIHFEWDPAKARLNLRKHWVTFEEAESVFSDDTALLIDDPDHAIGEERFLLLGFSERLRLIVVVHSYHEHNEVFRLISAREANRFERAQYLQRYIR